MDGEPGPTDVLSFPMDELTLPRDDEPAAEGLLGDVVICPEVATAQARRPVTTSAPNLGCCSRTASCICWVMTMPEPDEERLMSTAAPAAR